MKKKIILLMFSLVLAFVVLELGLHVLIWAGVMMFPVPSYRWRNVSVDFWIDHPLYGRWHPPLAQYRHTRECFSVEYRTNSVGARDRERSRVGEGPRVVVLGDSYVEGMGAWREERFSDVLERQTGIEYLNFGVSGSGPVDYYFRYKHLGRQYDHDEVWFVLLPYNDFRDNEGIFVESRSDTRAGRYFARNEAGGYTLVRGLDVKEKKTRRTRHLRVFLREFTYTYNALHVVKNRITAGEEPVTLHRKYSGYYDYTPDDLERLACILGLLVREAEGRPVTVIAMPILEDIQAYDALGEPPLSADLARICKKLGVRYLDLLPLLHDYSPDWAALHHTCDGHWNARGHAVVAQLLLKHALAASATNRPPTSDLRPPTSDLRPPGRRHEL